MRTNAAERLFGFALRGRLIGKGLTLEPYARLRPKSLLTIASTMTSRLRQAEPQWH